MFRQIKCCQLYGLILLITLIIGVAGIKLKSLFQQPLFTSDPGRLSRHGALVEDHSPGRFSSRADAAVKVSPPGGRQAELAFAKTLPARGHSNHAGNNGIQVDFETRGPVNVGGRTRALAIDIGNEDVIFAGGVTGGLWRSSDAGASWNKVTAFDQVQTVTCIVQDTRRDKSHIWYYGTGERIGTPRPGLPGDGIFKSVDGGISWQQLPATAAARPQDFSLGFNFCWNIAVDTSNSMQDELYVAGEGTIFMSLDGGDNWRKVIDGAFFSDELGIWDEVPTDVAVTANGAVYATIAMPANGGTTAAAAGVWRSTDGETWTNITPAGWPETFFRTVIALVSTIEQTVYFLASTPSFDEYALWKYTYLSGDGTGDGGDWRDLSDNLTSDFIGQFSYDMALAVKPDNSDIIYAGGIVLARSADGFSSAANTVIISEDATGEPNAPGLHVDQHTILFAPSDPNTIYVANDGGVFRTRDEVAMQNQWTSLNNGYITTQFYCVAIDQATPQSEVLLGGTQDNGTWFSNYTLETGIWKEILPGDGVGCAISDGGRYYYLWSSFNRGEGIWQAEIDAHGEVASLTPINARTTKATTGLFHLDPNDTDIMYAEGLVPEAGLGNSFILRNDKLDQPHENDNWTVLENSRVSGFLSAMAVSTEVPRHRLYYSSVDIDSGIAKLYRLENAHVSDELPVDVTPSIFPSDLRLFQFINSIAVHPGDGDIVIAVLSGYEHKSIFFSADAGVTWDDVSGNLEEHPDGSGNGPSMRAAAILPLENGKTFFLVGGSTGLYSTTELNGTNTIWMQEGLNSIGYTPVEDITVRHSDAFVVVATHGNGVFSANIDPGVVSVNPSPGVPESFTLSQNYPNPFNPSTEIRYHLYKQSEARLDVFNIRGERVRTLVHTTQSAGDYTITWDGLDDHGEMVAASVYFYRLSAGAVEQIRKMTLVR